MARVGKSQPIRARRVQNALLAPAAERSRFSKILDAVSDTDIGRVVRVFTATLADLTSSERTREAVFCDMMRQKVITEAVAQGKTPDEAERLADNMLDMYADMTAAEGGAVVAESQPDA